MLLPFLFFWKLVYIVNCCITRKNPSRIHTNEIVSFYYVYKTKIMLNVSKIHEFHLMLRDYNGQRWH